MEYIKDIEIIDCNSFDKQIQLIKSIKKAQSDLKKAHINFEFAEDELIDFYTYHIKALQSQIDYLTKIAKLKNVDFDSFSENIV